MIIGAIGFNVEGVDENFKNKKDKTKEVLRPVKETDFPENILDGVFDLTEKDNDYLFYRDQLMIKDSLMNFVCYESPKGPYAVSVAYDELQGRYVALIRSVDGNKRAYHPLSRIPTSWWRRMFRIGPSTTDILYSLDPSLPLNKLKRVADPRLPQALLSVEEQQQIKGFKFGILYAKEGQTKEDEMFSNTQASPEFEEFLDFIGTRQKLENWKGFRGGLDVKSGTTGEHMIYKQFNNNDIIYHVSTMLPFNDKDKQQLERKRHIGNDIVVIIFQDGETEYKPTTISSRQVHVVFVVKAVTLEDDPSTRYYRLAVVSREGVPEFGPTLPKNVLFKKNDAFLNFFYAKLLNAERACYNAPILSNKLSRTRTAILKDIAQNFT